MNPNRRELLKTLVAAPLAAAAGVSIPAAPCEPLVRQLPNCWRRVDTQTFELPGLDAITVTVAYGMWSDNERR